MAKSTKSSETKVTRIKASDSPRPKKTEVTKSSKSQKLVAQKKTKNEPEQASAKKRHLKVLGPIGRYFKGAWQELRQVRWPDRRTTWGMTGALLAFTAFFVVIILVLDALFAQLFNLLLGR